MIKIVKKLIEFILGLVPTWEKSKPRGLLFISRLTLYLLCVIITAEYYHSIFAQAKDKVDESKAYVNRAFHAVMNIDKEEQTKIENLIIREKKREYTIDELRQIVRTEAQEQGVSSLLAEAVVEQESNWRVDAAREEPHHANRGVCKKITNATQKRLCSSSWGLFQIMASVHQDTCKVSSWSGLLDPEVNTKCGVTILKNCLDRWKDSPPSVRLHQALICYNGGDDYPPKVLAVLGQMVAEGLV